MKNNKNNITKIIFLSCLIVSSSVSANNFQTCIPKEDWVLNVIRKEQEAERKRREEAERKRREEEERRRREEEERKRREEEERKRRELEVKFQIAKTYINDDAAWSLIVDNKTSGSLDVGIYRVILAGGEGGKGSDGENFEYGGIGGLGQIKKEVFLLTSTSSFSATIGNKGIDGRKYYEEKGKDGEKSSFSCSNNSYTADSGKGGDIDYLDHCNGGNLENLYCKGSAGDGYKDGNRGNGYVKIYKYMR